MVTIRATAGDVPITSGVHVAASSKDFAPTLAVGTRSRGCAGLAVPPVLTESDRASDSGTAITRTASAVIGTCRVAVASTTVGHARSRSSGTTVGRSVCGNRVRASSRHNYRLSKRYVSFISQSTA
ncbi:hypothetical protein NP493_1727g00000 [Ridgeia piscesae]|uniref:Uncharacterized protein n=1 Tax=Ridgeia piscesae TaxID=27915 RepID=A0AAD9N9S0_RIDPI|nr:hypothetical protein NP493_1727g00000 [Ridgeia piscesae]